MNAKKGIILLEVLISIMISSMIFMALMGAVFQLSKARVVVDNAIDVHTRVETILNLMQQDFQGATIPVQTEFPAEQSEKTEAQSSQTTSPKAEAKNVSDNSEQSSGKKEKEKPIKNIFYATEKDNNCDLISCITNNPTAIYWSQRAGKAKPRIVRIIYTLIPDPMHKESFVLKRQEGTELDLDAYKNPESSVARAYEVAEGIKAFKITYLYLEKKEDAQAQKQSGNSALAKSTQPKENQKEEAVKKNPEKLDYKSKNTWVIHQEKAEDHASKSKEPFLPAHLVISLVMFGSTYKQEYSFEYVITLPANEDQQIKQAKMRYQEDNSAKASLSDKSKPEQHIVQENDQTKETPHSDAKNSIELVVFNTTTQKSGTPRTPEALTAPHELLAENNQSQNQDQRYQQMISSEENAEDYNKDSAEKIDTISDNNFHEQINLPEGTIDIVRDGDTTHVVYQGPIAITPEMLKGVS